MSFSHRSACALKLTGGLGCSAFAPQAALIRSDRICEACRFGISPSVSYFMMRFPCCCSRHRIAQPVLSFNKQPLPYGRFSFFRAIRETSFPPVGSSCPCWLASIVLRPSRCMVPRFPFQKVTHFIFEEPQIFAQFDVRQSFGSSLACVLVNPRLGNFEQSSKLVNCEQSVKIPIRQAGGYSVGNVLRVCAHTFYG